MPFKFQKSGATTVPKSNECDGVLRGGHLAPSEVDCAACPAKLSPTGLKLANSNPAHAALAMSGETVLFCLVDEAPRRRFPSKSCAKDGAGSTFATSAQSVD